MKRSPLHLILLVAFVDLIGFGLIIPLQAVYATRLGADGFTFGLLVSSYSLMQFVFNPLLGRWSDRVGRRKVLILSLFGSVLSHTLLGFADLAHSLPLLFAARLLDGITGANISTAQAYIADVTDEKNRARGMGLFGAAFGMGFVCGPALGVLLAFLGRRFSGEVHGTSWPAFGAAFFSLSAAILVWRFLPESLRPGGRPAVGHALSLGRLREAAAHPRLLELLVFSLFASFAFVQLESNFSLFASRRFALKEAGTGLLFAYIGVIMVIVQGGLVGRLVRRFGEPRLLSVGPFLTAAGFAGITIVALPGASTWHWPVLLAGCAVVSLGSGITNPNLMSMVSRHAPPGRQGEILGLVQGMSSLSRTIGPPVAGLLYDRAAHWPYVLGAVLFSCLGAFAMSIRARQAGSLGDGPQPGAPARADAACVEPDEILL